MMGGNEVGGGGGRGRRGGVGRRFGKSVGGRILRWEK